MPYCGKNSSDNCGVWNRVKSLICTASIHLGYRQFISKAKQRQNYHKVSP